jgi:hypothetical protein
MLDIDFINHLNFNVNVNVITNLPKIHFSYRFIIKIGLFS